MKRPMIVALMLLLTLVVPNAAEASKQKISVTNQVRGNFVMAQKGELMPAGSGIEWSFFYRFKTPNPKLTKKDTKRGFRIVGRIKKQQRLVDVKDAGQIPITGTFPYDDARYREWFGPNGLGKDQHAVWMAEGTAFFDWQMAEVQARWDRDYKDKTAVGKVSQKVWIKRRR